MNTHSERCPKCGCQIYDSYGWGKIVHDAETCRGISRTEARDGVGCTALVGVAGGASDANVESVRAKLHQRAARGLQKYGVTTERTDLDTLAWLNHAQEEAMDFAVYLERLISDHKAAGSLTPTTPVSHKGANNL